MREFVGRKSLVFGDLKKDTRNGHKGYMLPNFST